MEDSHLRLHGEAEEEKEEEHGHQQAACDVLLSLSCGSSCNQEGAAPHSRRRRRRHTVDGAELFECRTCGRRFATFQALGGHRTRHLRCPSPTKHRRSKPVVVHACGTCGLRFSTGQALGGHMRRHRQANSIDFADMDLTQITMTVQERPSSASLQLLNLFV
ncbi:zinc finger protein ZAT11-like [Phragmites australis]|uniref:zinc finger protein ZAT11-like n=1 Tax=Phragmites australis TaxID=29695 RepID=UPI002D779DC0|nr:zinc finger protein ZAT11-like [Phragmites australis]